MWKEGRRGRKKEGRRDEGCVHPLLFPCAFITLQEERRTDFPGRKQAGHALRWTYFPIPIVGEEGRERREDPGQDGGCLTLPIGWMGPHSGCAPFLPYPHGGRDSDVLCLTCSLIPSFLEKTTDDGGRKRTGLLITGKRRQTWDGRKRRLERT